MRISKDPSAVARRCIFIAGLFHASLFRYPYLEIAAQNMALSSIFSFVFDCMPLCVSDRLSPCGWDPIPLSNFIQFADFHMELDRLLPMQQADHPFSKSPHRRSSSK